MGILVSVGTRDETKLNSGALHSIETCYYKSFANTNETVNYGMVQMSGGEFKMFFDRENFWFTASCLAHDTIDIFNMMTDCALEPRNFNSAGVAIEKLPFSNKAKILTNKWSEFSDMLFHSIYGDSGLGNLLYGNPSNYEHLDTYTMQSFQLDNISPEKISLCATGVENHNEFVDLVQTKLSQLIYNRNTSP